MKYGYLIINKDYYEIDSRDGKPIFKKVDKAKMLTRERRAKLLAKKLRNSLDGEKVLVESIMKLNDKDADKLYNQIFKSKIKYKPRTRADRCVDMKIGNFVLPVVD